MTNLEGAELYLGVPPGDLKIKPKGEVRES